MNKSMAWMAVVLSALCVPACGSDGDGGSGAGGGGTGGGSSTSTSSAGGGGATSSSTTTSTGTTSTTTTSTTSGGGTSASFDEAVQKLCDTACACVSCSDTDLADCVAEFGGDPPPADKPGCEEVVIAYLDCASAKQTACSESLETSLQGCEPSDADKAKCQ